MWRSSCSNGAAALRSRSVGDRRLSRAGEDLLLSRGAGPVPEPRGARATYLMVLSWAFTVFSSVRVLAYLPTLHALHASADSSQHSLWTWLTWLGANVTMAAWLYETGGQKVDGAVLVNIANAFMCLATVALIVAYRG